MGVSMEFRDEGQIVRFTACDNVPQTVELKLVPSYDTNEH